MKVSIGLVALLASVSPLLADTELVLAKLEGNVQVCDKSGACSPGEEGRALGLGEMVKVGEASKATLKLGKKDTFEIRERSKILVDQISPKESKFEMLAGSLKGTVQAAFFKKKKISVVTPTGVMAVRGTSFLCSVGDRGQTNISVLYGHVDFKGQQVLQGETSRSTGLSLAEVGGARVGREQKAKEKEEKEKAEKAEEGKAEEEAKVGEEGQKEEGKAEETGKAEGEEVGAEEKASGEEVTAKEIEQQQEARLHGEEPGLEKPGEERGGDFEFETGDMKIEDFAEAFGGIEGFKQHSDQVQNLDTISQEFVSDQQNVGEQVRTILENDLGAGRTLKDYHGNLVRVEQKLIRPSSDKIQFVNLVKRDSYVYAGFFAPDAGTLPSGSRRDSMDATITFDRDLPENINEWPTFFSDAGESLNVLKAQVNASNGTDSFESTSVYDTAKKNTGGTACDGSKVLGATCFQELYIKVGDKKALVYDHPTTRGEDKDGSVPGDLWNTAEQPLKVGTSDIAGVAVGDTLWLLFENYAIDNNGKILNINNILSQNILDPFAFMRTVAGEVILTVKKGSYDKTTNTGGSTLFSKGNIDLVMVPDLAVDLAQKFASHMEGFGTESAQ